MKKNTTIVLLILISAISFAQKGNSGNIILKSGWKMQSSLKSPALGAEISMPTFQDLSWYKVEVPTTVIAALLKNKRYDFDPFYGNNLQKIVGPEFDSSWWFRKTFELPSSEKGKNISLILHGINYRANVWLNGQLISDEMNTVGPFRIFEFDISDKVKYSGKNVLAIEIKRPWNPNKRDGDLAIDYADWIHYPADYNAGIVNDVELSVCNKVAVRHPLVITKLDIPSLATAHLEVNAELMNFSKSPEKVLVQGKINGNIHFQQEVSLVAGELKTVVFSSRDYPQLNINNPKIWWPWQYGRPLLNTITLTVMNHGKTSSLVSDHFGIREISSELIDNNSRKFIVNGKPIMLRGAAWSPDIFQRRSEERQEQEVRLVKDMNMNIIRSEGKMEDDHFYDLCDRYGMLVMTGWMCCGAWQYPERWNGEKRKIAMESARSVMYWLRNKACLLVWLNGSDMPPRDSTVEQDYLQIEKDLKWPNPILSTADGSVSKVSGYSGVKMLGPYEWVPPIYWETDSNKHGGAWSFATEISPGPSIPPYESLVKFIPEDSLSVTNTLWLYHCGTMEFGQTKVFNQALDGRYGPSSTIKEFVAKAQAQNYEAHRAMMEAYGQYKYNTATGVVQWMLSNPWPGLIWHTYDYYLYPAGTYFGMKKSMEPLHIQYSYKSREVIINNSLLKAFKNLQVSAEVFDFDGKSIFSKKVVSAVEPDQIQKCFAIPDPEGISNVYFLKLQLKDPASGATSINWYWLSKKADELDWKKSKWFYTPQSAYTDFSGLKNLPPTTLKANYSLESKGETISQKITVTNIGKSVAFFVHVRVLRKRGGEDILPVIFEDNYLLLAPGETRNLSCSYLLKDAEIFSPYVQVSAWNLDQSKSIAGANVVFVNAW